MYKQIILLTVIFLSSCLKPQNDDMVFIEGGTFQMGDIWKEYNDRNALTVHEVTVDDFYMAKYNVTFEEFIKFLNDADGVTNDGKLHGNYIVQLDSFAFFKSAIQHKSGKFIFDQNRISDNNKCPVTWATWFGAMEYCNWLSEKEKLRPFYTIKTETIICNTDANGYRLPTEAEWEYAAIGGVGMKQEWSGTDDTTSLGEYSWYYKNSGDKKLTFEVMEKYSGMELVNFMLDSNHCKTHPVGEKLPNPLGIYDMCGNVLEFCYDFNRNVKSDTSIFQSNQCYTGSSFIIKGGIYRYHELLCKTSYRNLTSCGGPNTVNGEIGFRICRSAK
ncbi:MAG: SUMF1/EgtB/PvdO family nonheme iron enzyme [Candidatus Marinimicrobia bacterium]|nr:SUMF1/EgtB/PvdO family nonheme iron enzyme [Candidatus Neomarinimicrobiota bacterium]